MGTYTYEHPRPSVTVDIVVFHARPNSLQVLLIQRAREPYQDTWALPGGFVEMHESLEATARRELQEETGLSVPSLEQLGAYGDPERDPRGRVISIAYMAVLPEEADSQVVGASDASRAAWFPINDLPPLAFDHNKILRDARRNLLSRY
ncbi:MAG: NUDIX hydrolase [Anaerolineales bacterium]|jgi:8-oxo-dGTP diphosphatase